ncbi:unannotated protein [freshwater metagenome]|uniref:Unannotated protein n=1 Tax=freshwater metagenome TaxID=449393 RepID=A0A6J6TWH4_9ZZZZ
METRDHARSGSSMDGVLQGRAVRRGLGPHGTGDHVHGDCPRGEARRLVRRDVSPQL